MGWWPLPTAVWLAVPVAGVVVWLTLRGAPREAIWRGRLLAALRGLSVPLFALGLTLPHSPAPAPSQTLPDVTLAVDTSLSMSLPGKRPGETRLSEAIQALKGLAGELRARGAEPPRLVAFDEATRPVAEPSALDARGAGTDLAACLGELAAQGVRGNVVVLSDGQDTTGARARQVGARAAGHGMRLLGLCAEGDARLRDAAVDGLSGPRRVRAGSPVNLVGQVRLSGMEGAGLKAELLRDGVVEARPVVPRDGGALTLKARAGSVGLHRYALRVAPQTGELSAANNAAAVTVEVIPDKPRVLLFAAAPSPEYARLKALLLGDPGLRVSCYVVKGAGGQLWRDDTRLEAVQGVAGLREANAVISLGAPTALLDGPARLVRSGQGLLVAPVGGGMGAPAGLLPLRVTGRRTATGGLPLRLKTTGSLGQALAEAGLRVSDLPAPRTVLPTRTVAGTEVVLGSGGRAVLAAWTVGRGRVAALTTDETYRWLLSAQADERSRRGYEQFWGALVGWLTAPQPAAPVTAQLDRDTYETGLTARLVVHVTDGQGRPVPAASVEARWSGAGLSREPVRCGPSDEAQGAYQGLVALERAGEVRVAVTARQGGRMLGKAEARAQVLEATRELRQPEANRAWLKAACEASGGRLLEEARAAELLPEGEGEAAAGVPRALEPWALGLAVGLWAADWWLRRRWWG